MRRVEAVGVPQELARSLEDLLLVDLGQRAGVLAISPAELEHTLQFAQSQAELGCDELDACVAEVQRKLGADQWITLKLGRLGGDFALTLVLFDVGTRRVLRRAAGQSSSFAELKQGLSGWVDALLGTAAPAQRFRLSRGSKLELAVVPLVALGVPAETADSMSQILATEYSHVEGVSVISQDDVRAMLHEVERQAQLGCTDNLSCVAELGAALGLSKLIAGSVGKVGGTYLIALRLIDTRQVVVLNRTLESFDADALELRHAVKKAALELLGVELGGSIGGLDVTLNVPAGRGQLDDRAFRFEQYRFALDALPPGRYSLRLTPDDASYLPFRSDVYVPVGTRNVRSFELAASPTAWYEQWWVWTIAGGLIAAGATTAVLLNRDPPANGEARLTVGAVPMLR